MPWGRAACAAKAPAVIARSPCTPRRALPRRDRASSAIVATKVMDIEAALADARAMVGPETLVLAIQNGLGNVERVQRVLGAENVLFGIAGGFGAELKASGHVHHNGMEAINLAELRGRHQRAPEARRRSLARGWLQGQRLRRPLAGGVEQAGRERRLQRDLHGDWHAGRAGAGR